MTSYDPVWNNGYLAMALYKATPWLGYLAVAAAVAATFAQLSSSIMSMSRVLWAASKSSGKYKHYPAFVSWSWQRHTVRCDRDCAQVCVCLCVCALTSVSVRAP